MEKIIVKSEQYNVKKFFKIMLVIGAVFSILVAFTTFRKTLNRFEWYEETYEEHQADGSCGYYYDSWEKCYECENYEKGALGTWFEGLGFIFSLAPLAFFALIGGLIYLWLRSYEMTVTDKRVYGKVAWGKRVDLPLDSVSSTATIGLFKGDDAAVQKLLEFFQLVCRGCCGGSLNGFRFLLIVLSFNQKSVYLFKDFGGIFHHQKLDSTRGGSNCNTLE